MKLYLMAAFFVALPVSGADIPCAGDHTLRAATREWSDFPERAPARLECLFEAPADSRLLVLRQVDVKRADWRVTLNGLVLGNLLADEHRQMLVLNLPEGLLRASGNRLVIATAKPLQLADDIRVDRIAGQPAGWLSQARLRVRVARRMPVRITLADAERTLLAHGARSQQGTAARTGVVYAINGEADIPVPAGSYTVWASRGFEYSAARKDVAVKPGETREVRLAIRREVQIPPGWTGGDTHLHTLERSGHGDATVAERIVSIAGEGLDWAVCTEHNLASTYDVSPGTFRAIQGVEVTTAKGHFNVFPWPVGKAVPDVRGNWPASLTPDMAVIWNHPRDTHSGYQPFDPAHYIDVAGEGHPFPGNAIEVVNSGAMYSHPLQLAEDWMRLLNRGRAFAAIGSSDSHTVTTFAAGQARTYVKGDDVAAAIQQGHTAVSYGLVAFLEQHGSKLVATVQGPSWSRAERLRVYANGELIEERPLGKAGRWQGEITPPRLKQDAFLVVIATGGDDAVFWPISRPYQPVTPDWKPMTLGISPALRWDGDGDGKFETPRQQAEGLLSATSSIASVVERLRTTDAAVAAQVGLILREKRQLNDLMAAAGTLPARSQEVLRRVAEQIPRP